MSSAFLFSIKRSYFIPKQKTITINDPNSARRNFETSLHIYSVNGFYGNNN